MLKKLLLLVSLVLAFNMQLAAQDTVFNVDGQKFTLTDAIVRNHFDYKDILNRIKQDTSFYKAFKTLRTIGYSSYNYIQMMDENNKLKNVKKNLTVNC